MWTSCAICTTRFSRGWVNSGFTVTPSSCYSMLIYGMFFVCAPDLRSGFRPPSSFVVLLFIKTLSPQECFRSAARDACREILPRLLSARRYAGRPPCCNGFVQVEFSFLSLLEWNGMEWPRMVPCSFAGHGAWVDTRWLLLWFRDGGQLCGVRYFGYGVVTVGLEGGFLSSFCVFLCVLWRGFFVTFPWDSVGISKCTRVFGNLFY